MFRTPTGQTGTDAYIYEAAQIVNAQQALNRRAARLAEAMATELPDTLPVKFDMSTDQFPDATFTSFGESLRRMIRLNGYAMDAEYLGRIAKGLADPSYVVRHDND